MKYSKLSCIHNKLSLQSKQHNKAKRNTTDAFVTTLTQSTTATNAVVCTASCHYTVNKIITSSTTAVCGSLITTSCH